jgi:thioredoxin:protein disulfide reductase
MMKKVRLPMWRVLLWSLLTLACATPSLAAETFLPPEQAFVLSAQMLGVQGQQRLELSFAIAPGYYLYREPFKFESAQVKLAAPVLPTGKVKFDENFQKNVETYRGLLNISLGVDPVPAQTWVVPVTQPWVVQVTSQGCADKGLCYPPRTHQIHITPRGSAAARVEVVSPEASSAAQPTGGGLSGLFSAGSEPGSEQWSTPSQPKLSSSTGAMQIKRLPAKPAELDATTNERPALTASPSGAVAQRGGAQSATSARPNPDPDRFSQVLRAQHWGAVLALFFIAGLLLSFTPCVLPMLPILSALIVGDAQAVSRKRGFALALSYSLGMALVYTAFGVAAGLAGQGLAAFLQHPWVLSGFALGLALLALSMWGAYDVALPGSITNRFNSLAQRLPAGRMASVFAMGGVSALIVSPCVAAPLAGALLYLSQTRDVALGGMALFALAMGMSVPLLLLGISAGAWLPKAGAWMEGVKRFFGLLLLSVALWTVQILLPPPLVLILWGVLSVAAGVLLWGSTSSEQALSTSLRVWRLTSAGLCLVWGVLLWLGAASGGVDALQPLSHWRFAASSGPSGAPVSRLQPLPFQPLRSVQDLSKALQNAGRPVMLDVYADWCVACKELERDTFAHPQVQRELSGALLLRADVTANNPQDRELLKSLGLFGPPGVLFWDEKGHEIVHTRVIGYQNAEAFLGTLREVFGR